MSVDCAHCGLPTHSSTAPAFCCNGCRAVHHLLDSEGLGEFYHRLERDGGNPRPVRELEELSPLTSHDLHVDSDESGRATTVVAVEGITCAACVWLLERGVSRLPGVVEFAVNFANHRARVTWELSLVGLPEIDARVRSLGYALRPTHLDTRPRGDGPWLARIGVAAFCTMNLMWISVGLYAGYFQGMEAALKRGFHLLNWALATPVLFYSGDLFWRGAWRGLRGRALTMDLLVCLGTGIAYIYSVYATLVGRGETYFDSVAMIISLLLAGRFLEHRSRARASEATDRLVSLLPSVARAWRDGAWREVALAEVAVGDRLQVHPGERIPADGVLAASATDVDESMLTGESRPVHRSAGDRLTAGTLNLQAPVEMKVEALGESTRLAAIGRLLERAQISRPPIARLADRLAAWFVAAVIGLASVTWLYWRGRGLPLDQALLPTLTVLIVACPCALGLATPVAILAGTTVAGRRGILFKSGIALESLARVRRVLLDKTGTLTLGRLRLLDSRPLSGFDDSEDALALASSLAEGSRHPVARALVDATRGEMAMPEVTKRRELPGRGMVGWAVDGEVRIGRPSWVFRGPELIDDERRTLTIWRQSGDTVVAMATTDGKRALFRLSDTPRPGAAAAVEGLRSASIDASMLTGDAAEAAAAVADRLAIDDYRAELTPEEKLAQVDAARGLGPVAMVGDGINDGPALASATVGIALARGLDVAVEAADVILLGESLHALPEAVTIARTTRRTIQQNYAVAIAYNMITIPLAAAGLMLPVFAAAAMAASSLTVTLNSMRMVRRAKAIASPSPSPWEGPGGRGRAPHTPLGNAPSETLNPTALTPSLSRRERGPKDSPAGRIDGSPHPVPLPKGEGLKGLPYGENHLS